MNLYKDFCVFASVSFAGATLFTSPLAGQDEVREIEALQLSVERLQQEADEQQALHRRQLEELQQQVDRLEAEQARAPSSSTVEAPVRKDFLNLSLIGTFAAGASTERHVEDLQGGHHDPSRRGFSVQSVELALDGIVDPYFRAQANIAFVPGGHDGSSVELEEAYLETLALPGNLQVRAGQFFTEFGRHNTQHLHAWKFVDQPLINHRMFGPDGLRNPGARVAWLVPTPFYSELFFGVQDSSGETAYSFRNEHGFHDGDAFFRGAPIDAEATESLRKVTDLLYTARYAASLDLTATQSVLAGLSAAFGPNPPTEATATQPASSAGRTEIYGADLYWLWAPGQLRGYPFVSWQTEAMLRRFEVRDPSEVFHDYGLYSQINYGFRRGWVAGLRYDVVRGDMNEATTADGESMELANRWRVSPNLTYYPSEFSQVRLQYNYDERSGFGGDHSVWLQWAFSLGPHAPHSF